MSRRKNNFTKAMSHLKSNRIDEKINQLEEQPTNNTYGLMTVGDPSHTVQPPDIEVTELDFNKGNDDDNGRDTSGIFNEEGEILTIEPNVGDTSYILGPMASMYYGWWSGGTSTIGYIRESDRKMVNLGTVPGVFDSWDGTTGFNSYGQLTLEQAQWFKNTPKKNDYRAFYPGPPSNTPDAFGRYECEITSTPKEFEKTPPPYVTSPTQGPESASDQFSGQLDQAEKDKNKSEEDERKELMKRAREIDAQSKKTVDYLNSQGVGQDQAAAMAIPLLAPWLVKSLVAAAGVMSLEQLRQAVSSWNGVYQSNTAAEDEWLDSGEMDKARERSRADDAAAAKAARERAQAADEALDDAIASGDQGKIDAAQTEVDNAAKNQERVQNQVAANRRSRGKRNRPGQRNRPGEKGTTGQMHGDLGMYNSYKPQGKVLSEGFSKRHIKLIKERKKEFKVPELPKKYKMNFAGKYSSQNTPDVTASKRSDELVASGNAKGQRWRAEDKYWQGYETTERMNVIYDRVGHGEQAWERVIGEARRQNAWKNREIQEQLNIIEHEKAHRKIYEDYESPWGHVIHEENPNQDEIATILKDPLLKKVQKRLKKEIDYPDKPSKKGYPNEPPPEMINNWHPKLGKKMPYKKLDPESAKMMPNTGDPDIDVNIEKARKKPK